MKNYCSKYTTKHPLNLFKSHSFFNVGLTHCFLFFVFFFFFRIQSILIYTYGEKGEGLKEFCLLYFSFSMAYGDICYRNYFGT